MEKYIYFVFIIIFSGRLLWCQTSTEDAIRATNILPPETFTFKFNSAGNVDNHGDYSAGIPLMTVPGRGGMDYPISLSYKSGITTDQRATWVGLGWNLNPGSVTRVVNGIPDNIHKMVLPNGYTENGAITHYPPMEGASYYRPDKEYFDNLLITIPGVMSGLAVPVAINSDSTVDYSFQEYNGYLIQIGYATFDRIYRGTVALSSTTSYTDISVIVITDPQGTSYHFALPLRSEMILSGGSTHFEPRFVVEYISSWQLTAIVSHDGTCIDINGTSNVSTSGNWIKFEYNYPYNSTNAAVRNIRPLYFNRYNPTFLGGHDRDPYGLLTQTTYLSRIITPTHEAHFITSPRNDISFLCPQVTLAGEPYKTGITGDYTNSANNAAGTGSFIKPLRLDTIKLYQIAPSSVLTSFVQFIYAAQGNELCRYGINVSNTPTLDNIQDVANTGTGSFPMQGIGKTTLLSVKIADSTQGQFYRFKYTDSVDAFNPPYIITSNEITTFLNGNIQGLGRYSNSAGVHPIDGAYFRERSNRMGLLYLKASEASPYGKVIADTKGAAAWSLRTIEYPTGAIDTINYEKDQFNKAVDQALSNLVVLVGATNKDEFWQNFADDEAGIRVRSISSFDPLTSETRRVSYQYFGGHLYSLPLSYLRNSNQDVGCRWFFRFLYGYNSAEVGYDTLQVINSDGSSSQTVYTSGGYDEQVMSPNFMVVDDLGYERGKPIAAYTYDGLGQITSKVTSLFSVSVQFSGFYIYAPFPILVSNTIGGKKLGISYAVQKLQDSLFHYEINTLSSSRTAQISAKIYSYTTYMQLAATYDKYPGLTVNTVYTYAYEAYPSLANDLLMKNRIGLLAGTSVAEHDGNTGYHKSQTRVSFRRFSGGQIYADTVGYWQDVNRNRIADYVFDPVTQRMYFLNEMIPAKIVSDYDQYGNPLEITDVNGIKTQFQWSPAYANARLTEQSTTHNGLTLTKRYTYNTLHLPKTIEDENGMVTTYIYDGLGRLKSIFGPDGKLLKSYQYNFKNKTAITWPQY